MTDPELVAKKLAFVESCVRQLQTLARPERIAEDVREPAATPLSHRPERSVPSSRRWSVPLVRPPEPSKAGRSSVSYASQPTATASARQAARIFSGPRRPT